MKISFIYLFAILFAIQSCKKDYSKTTSELDFGNTTDTLINKRLNIPSKLCLYKPYKNYLLDSMGIARSEFKVISYVDASCVTCIQQIKLWNEFALEFAKLETPVVLVLGTTKGDFEFLKLLCESGEVESFSYPYFLDKDSEFKNKNKFIEQLNHTTLLTNKNNTILLTGDALYSKSIKESFIRKIKGH